MLNKSKQNCLEIESKILEINQQEVISLLKKAGAKKILDTISIIETYDFKNDLFKENQKTFFQQKFSLIFNAIEEFLKEKNTSTLLEKGAYLRIRQEGESAELIFKYPHSKKKGIKIEKEVSIQIKLEEIADVSQNLIDHGFKKVMYQEKKRISYLYEKLNGRFDIDTWPGVPTYVEIEAPNRTTLLKLARIIGYTSKDLNSIGARELFKRYSVSPTYLSFIDGQERIDIKKLQTIIFQIIKSKATYLTEDQVNLILDHYLSAELAGKKTHGIRKLCWDLQFYDERDGTPIITKENSTMALINGNKEIGPIAVELGVRMVVKKAKANGMGLVAITGAQRFGVLATWTEMIAKEGFIGIITTSTEPFATVYGTTQGVVGTNPLSIAIPYKSSAIVFDAAMSKAPANTIWLNRSLGEDLPNETFLDENGNYTTNPFSARFVDTFGGAKGSGISLMMQILSGPLLGVTSHGSFKDSYQNGFYLQAIDPCFFQSRNEFEKIVEDLVKCIKKSPVRKGYPIVSLPGELSKNVLNNNLKMDKILVSGHLIKWLEFLIDT